MANYIATLSQTGTNAPVATEAGTVTGAVWSYVAVGQFRCTKTGAFPSGAVFFQPNFPINYTTGAARAALVRVSDNAFDLFVTDEGGNATNGFSGMQIYVLISGTVIDGTNYIASLDDVKAFLNISGTGEDTFLEGLIARTSDYIENYCQIKFKLQTISNEIHDGNGRQSLSPEWIPVASLPNGLADVQYRDNPDADWQNREDNLNHVFVRPHYIELYDSYYPIGRQNVRITYTAGYNPIPGDVVQVFFEMIQIAFTESKHDNSALGRVSHTLSAGATNSESLKDMNPRWFGTLEKYRRFVF